MINILYSICFALISMGLENSEVLCRNESFIIEKSIENNIDPIDFISILWVESRFTPNLISKNGSCGIAQINPIYTDFWIKKSRTKKEKRDYTFHICNKIIDEKINIEIGIKKYSYWFNVYAKKDKRISFCAYNFGFRCKNENNIKIPKNVEQYIKNIVSFSINLRNKSKKLNKKIK